MYPVVNKNKILPYEFPDIPGYLNERIPTFERTLDRYFDSHFEAIIEEWGLPRSPDLTVLEQRLDTVTADISQLCKARDAMVKRAGELDTLITELEGSK